MKGKILLARYLRLKFIQFDVFMMDRNKMLENSKRIAKFLPSTSSKKFPNLLETEWNAGGKIRDRQIYLSESASNKERRDHEVSSRRASRPSIWHREGGVSLFSVTRSAYGIFGECLVSERSAAAFGMPDSPREGDRKGCETLRFALDTDVPNPLKIAASQSRYLS